MGLFYQAKLIADGRELTYEANFFKERRNGANREYSSQNVPEGALPKFITLARAKSASVKLIGLKTTKTIVLTPAQQVAMLNQLKIYKGLILMYDQK